MFSQLAFKTKNYQFLFFLSFKTFSDLSSYHFIEHDGSLCSSCTTTESLVSVDYFEICNSDTHNRIRTSPETYPSVVFSQCRWNLESWSNSPKLYARVKLNLVFHNAKFSRSDLKVSEEALTLKIRLNPETRPLSEIHTHVLKMRLCMHLVQVCNNHTNLNFVPYELNAKAELEMPLLDVL